MTTCRRWAFVLKDKANAWRFARKMHLHYFREDRYGTDFVTRAKVLD